MNVIGAVWAAGVCVLGLVHTSLDAASPPLGVYDGNGVLLGQYLGSTDGIWVNFASTKGFIARVMVDTESSETPNGTIDATLTEADTWNSTDCSGPVLSAVPVAGRLVTIRASETQLGYIRPDANPVLVPAGAIVSSYVWDSSECVTRALSRSTIFLPALPNDPIVTGISGGVVALPIKIAFVDGVFRAGFDTVS